eukprot:TRINITY_DN76255_c0_g1_i1.p1 TRINITY_DN76255_c0_g1~~TRINITY_DN76255_c0_g1_i1.p1  ORF type:complete len:411 (-),score=61.21 TRINITY_DN76255_c0_g1_i1:239-1471(-)
MGLTGSTCSTIKSAVYGTGSPRPNIPKNYVRFPAVEYACTLQTESLRGLPEFDEKEQKGEGATQMLETAEEEVEDQVDLRALDENAFGALVAAIIVNLPRVRNPEDGWLHRTVLLFALILYILNLAMQSTLLYYIRAFIVLPSVRQCQTLLMDFSKLAYDQHGKTIPGAAEQFGQLGDLCNVALLDLPFHSVLLLCWTLTVLVEFRGTFRLLHDLMELPEARTSFEMVVFKDDEVHISVLTKWTRLVLILGVAVPKVCLSVSLLWLGSQFLASTISMSDLVLNAVAMDFVMNLDEMLYEAVLPPCHREKVAATFFHRRSAVTEEGRCQEEIAANNRSATYLIAGIVYVIVYYVFLQSVLPPPWLLADVVALCYDFNKGTSESLCQMNGIWSLTGHEAMRECYNAAKTQLN